jgi:hypothetical protein
MLAASLSPRSLGHGSGPQKPLLTWPKREAEPQTPLDPDPTTMNQRECGGCSNPW